MRLSRNQKMALTLVVSAGVATGLYFNSYTSPKEVNPPKKVTETSKQEAGKAKEGYVLRDLFLIDQNGYVVPQAFELPASNSAIKQAVEYLVQNGPVSEMLPDGFKASIPTDTEVSVDLKADGTLVLDFSREFKNYQKEDEAKILQSIVWTATQFSNVKEVKLQVNGVALAEMPVGKTPIATTLDRSMGINLQKSDVVDLTNSKSAIVYYVAQIGSKEYYVPVTKRIANSEKNNYVAIVNELIKGPSYETNLLSDFNSDVALLNEPTYENGLVTLNFNENILSGGEQKSVSKYTLDALVLSLTEQPGVEKVAIQVDGKANALDQKGKTLSKAVDRPQHINASSY